MLIYAGVLGGLLLRLGRGLRFGSLSLVAVPVWLWLLSRSTRGVARRRTGVCLGRLGLGVAEQGQEMPSGLLWVIRYLSPLLSVSVRGEVPSPRPAEFVKVGGAGGADGLVTGDVQLLIEYWAPTTLAAEAGARKVHGLLSKAPGVTVQGVKCRGFVAAGLPYDMPDPDAGVPRWRQSVVLKFRKTTV